MKRALYGASVVVSSFERRYHQVVFGNPVLSFCHVFLFHSGQQDRYFSQIMMTLFLREIPSMRYYQLAKREPMGTDLSLSRCG